ncbi:MAG TPA: hypothetical protein VHW24_27945 [Bryobacteraceae bacterium]|nr:hypothetical protein [Bryobacteraceae bacterium]
MRLAFAGILLALAAHADVVTMKDGRVINGTYIGGTPRQIKVEVGDQIETLDVSAISRIEFSNGSSTSSSSRGDSGYSSDPDRPTLRRGSSASAGPTAGPVAGPMSGPGSGPVMVQPDPSDPRTQAGPGGGGSYSSDRPTLRRSTGSSTSDSASAPPTQSAPPSDDSRPTLKRAPGSSSDAPPQPAAAAPTAAAPDAQPAQPAKPAAPVTVPAQTSLVVRMIDAIDSEKAKEGQSFVASLDQPVVVNGQTVLPTGSDVIVKLVQAQQSGKFTGKTELTVSLWSVKVGDKFVDVDTQNITEASSSRGAKTAKVAGGAAAVGAVIGAVAGGGKGAAIGAGAGAAGGAAVQAVTKGEKVKIASETRLTFTLEKPLTI